MESLNTWLCLMMMLTLAHVLTPTPTAAAPLKLSKGPSSLYLSDGKQPIATPDFNDVIRPNCTMTEDLKYSGAFINCTNRGLDNINPAWFPKNTTTLLLDNNNISSLLNQTFKKLKSLRVLSVKNSKVKQINVDTLKGLHRLKILNLEYNDLQLSHYAFPKGMFRHTPNLQELYIAFNNRKKASSGVTRTNSRSDSYPEYIDIFLYLTNLRSLSIDTFNVMKVGQEFKNMTRLNNLTLFCANSSIVTNESFVGLNGVKLKHLSLKRFSRTIIVFGRNAFQYLTHLDSLTIEYCNTGNRNFLAALGPFVNKSMTSVELISTNFPEYYDSPRVTYADGILTRNVSTFLSNMCVINFTWKQSILFAVHPDALSRGLFAKCVKFLDLSDNNMGLIGWRVDMFQFSLFRSVETIILTSIRNTYNPMSPIAEMVKNNLDVNTKLCINSNNRLPKNSVENSYGTNDNDIGNCENSACTVIRNNEVDELVQVSDWQLSVDLSIISQSAWNIGNGEFYIRLPGTLRSMTIDNLFSGTAPLHNFSFVNINSDNFTELYFTNNHLLIVGSGRVLGLHNLQLLDVSGSIFEVNHNFFDELVNLQTLIMQSMKPDDFFVRIPLWRILYTMHSLLHLDISNNGLNYIKPDVFSNNPLLKTLVISKNRFTNIPFDMRLTPQLESLDLTHNAIYILGEDERRSLDSQVHKIGYFTLIIQDNAIDCACSRVDFLTWLQTTSVNLDNHGNYSCISQAGIISFTGEITDIPAFWRQCRGGVILLWSFILASLMIAVFLVALLLMRFRTALEAFALRVFAGAFRPMTPADYKTNVFIGYADEDVLFVRYILRRYLEDSLGASTFIHHRDMVPGYTDQQFFIAIRDSWRVLLVISEEFLQRYDLAHVVMKYASHSVTPVNQGRVFVLVEETQLYNLPDYLHGVLDDSRIIIIQDLHQQLDYEQKQKIQQCLRPA